VAIEEKVCTAKRSQVPVSPAKFDVNRCNESPLWGEKPHFWPVSKFNTGSLPLSGILPVKNKQKTNTTFSHLQRCTILSKLCMVIELVVPIMKGEIHFSIQRMDGPYVFDTLDRKIDFTLQGARKNLATAGAHCAIFPKLCTVIELVVPIIKCVIHSSHSFSYRVHGTIWPNLPTRGFSAITP